MNTLGLLLVLYELVRGPVKIVTAAVILAAVLLFVL